MARPVDLDARKAAVVAGGLPCRLRFRREGDWSCLDVLPEPGFVHLVSDQEARAFELRGEHYHVSLGWSVDDDLLGAIAARWDGVVTTIRIAYVADSCVANLEWVGLGAMS